MFRINTTTLTAAPASLILRLPFGLTVSKTLYQLFMANPTALPTEAGIVEMLAGQQTMQFQRFNANWVIGANQTYISGVITFEAT